jgi:hypothetical protein
MPSAAEAAAADALQRMRYFAHFSDADGLIMAAGELEKAAPNLLYHDVLLKETAPRQLIRLMANARPDAQIAACRALVACCRFPTIQQEFVAENGVGGLMPLLSREGVAPMVCVAACLAATAVAQHPEGQEALTGAGALRKLMVLARDELHPAQDEAAAALAAVGGHRAAAASAGGKSVSGQDAAESFVVMVASGGAVSREQARRYRLWLGWWGWLRLRRRPAALRSRPRAPVRAAARPLHSSPPPLFLSFSLSLLAGVARHPAALRHGAQPAAPHRRRGGARAAEQLRLLGARSGQGGGARAR